jgi:hypothetical protein
MPKTTAWPDLKLRDLRDDFERLGRQVARWAAAARQRGAPPPAAHASGNEEPDQDQ